MIVHGTAKIFSHADDDRPSVPFPEDYNPPAAAYPLLQLYQDFCVRVALHRRDWNELLPLLDSLPDELPLVQPRINARAAEQALGRYLRGRDGPRHVRWFPDVKSAIAYDSSIAVAARPAFPAIDCCPRAISKAWFTAAGTGEKSMDWAASQLDQFEIWRAEKNGGGKRPMRSADGEIRSLATLIRIFAAGVFYYWIGPAEIVCVARPSLWLEEGKLHRLDGPAVEWTTGECLYFWRDNEVPKSLMDSREAITAEQIRKTRNLAHRAYLIERFGTQPFSILECWQEWRNCRSRPDFEPFVACGLDHAFAAVSKRITRYAEAAVEHLSPADFRSPRIDKKAVAAALARFLTEWGERPRELRWFESARAARAYIRGKSSEPLRAAYWPQLRVASLLDTIWYRGMLSSWVWADEDWQDWSIAAPRSLDCDNPQVIRRRLDRRLNWQRAISSYRDARSTRPDVSVSLNDPAVRRWTPLIDAFSAGLFCYWLGWDEIVCVPRPALWIENNRFHREDGPAVEWARERQYFVHGMKVPNWMFERPEKITANAIRAQSNVEIRRWMLEHFGFGRFLRRSGGSLIAEDRHGRLWRTQLSPQGQSQLHTILEVRNGSSEPDGTYRQYFLLVPPDMPSPRAAVAWTYGVTTEQYELAVRT